MIGETTVAQVVGLDDLTATYRGDDVLFAEDVARALGISTDTLRSMASKGKGPPAQSRRRQDAAGRSRRWWRRADVVAYRDTPRGMHGRGLRLHARLAALDVAGRGLRSFAELGREVGVSGRTVARHLRGECGCGCAS